MRAPPDSFEAFFGEHYESVFQALAVAIRDPSVAEASTREAFGRAFTRWDRIRRAERPEAWLHVTATRIALRRDRSGPGPHTSEPETLERAIEGLPQRERLALVLHHHAGLTAAEMGRALGGSATAANATLREAHRRLGIESDDDDDIPEVELDDAG
jgi:RNA polymerase sigma-70 factor, ECF subfamily